MLARPYLLFSKPSLVHGQLCLALVKSKGVIINSPVGLTSLQETKLYTNVGVTEATFTVASS